MSDPGDSDPNLFFRRAISLQRSGQVAQAAALYRQLLQRFPAEPQILYLLGTAELQLGNSAESVALLSTALELAPGRPEVLSNLAIGLRNLKRFAASLEAYDRAIALAPDLAEAYNNRGDVLKDLKRPEDALASYDRAIAAKPDYAKAYYNRGNTLIALGRPEEALASYDRAVALAPHAADGHNNRGNALRSLMRPAEALDSFDRAIAAAPDRAEAHCNRGGVLIMLKRPEEALAAYERAIALKPDYAKAHNGRGTALLDLMRIADAQAAYRRAIALDPDCAEAHWNLAFVTLLTGDLAAGWELFEWRWQGCPAIKATARHFSRPQWQGEPLAGRTLLVHAEQGYGDVVQFCRYLPMLAASGARVAVEAPAPLLPLLATLQGDFAFVAAGDALPDFDLHCPMMSLPRAFKTTLETVPANVPYLSVAPDEPAMRRHDPGAGMRPRIGLCWAGKPTHDNDRNRSIALARLAPLLCQPFAFHAVQKDIPPEDETMLAEFPRLCLHRGDLNDFSDTAALIAEMDLTISVDTSVAHVAGALGKPVWILLPYLPDWRWLLDRGDSPWYPTATLFRQPAAGDWASAIGKVADRLRRTAGDFGKPA